LPNATHSVWENALTCGDAPVFTDGLSSALLSHLRLSSDGSALAECGGGLYGHLADAARRADSFSSLLALAATKKYTDSRIRRATLFSYFGVTPDALREKPLYTQVLAMDAVGRRLLAHMRKTAGLSVLTKPADLEKLPAPAAAQAKRAYRADSVYTLAMPKVKEADLFIRRAPFVKDMK
ncbi:MAG: nucleotidyltransferase family protein, partial [Clostridia bacterium]|nr:nucleotidyltransferase family protein [Clostridia bacterium]